MVPFAGVRGAVSARTVQDGLVRLVGERAPVGEKKLAPIVPLLTRPCDFAKRWRLRNNLPNIPWSRNSHLPKL